ncbi:MAG: TlpA family protein disulfide reductase [Syntrophaceae bacterium]|nr:TlpA family protein disulfide reductase [Syntrophaceae bacterium]
MKMGAHGQRFLLRSALLFGLCLGWTFFLPQCAQEKKPLTDWASDFSLKALNDQEITLSRLRGKVVLLDFWATWCSPCRESIPHLVQLYRTYRENEFEIIGMSIDKGGEMVVRHFAKSMEIPYPIVMTPEDVARAYRVTSIPTLFLIDREGKIRERITGFNLTVAQQIHSKIGAIISEKP